MWSSIITAVGATAANAEAYLHAWWPWWLVGLALTALISTWWLWSRPQKKRARRLRPSVLAAITSEDRDYVRMMYEEHGEQARQHETLHAILTSLLVALIAGIFIFAANKGTDSPEMWVSGASICFLSMLGTILNQKHYERNRLHADVMLGLRISLEKNLSSGISSIPADFQRWHNRNWSIWSKVSLHVLWNVVYAVTFMIGSLMVYQNLLKCTIL